MTAASTAQVPTKSGSRYLQQLCKHWQHNLAVEYRGARDGEVPARRPWRELGG